ncbi:MAG TPA: tripartite tricarboxylate transporter substrate binding protein [Geminicoccaceae bacterium]|nr:tripartite tricarboxylate transporter substrate binding protein [Geminicoccaceae bacterium]
MGKLWSRHRLAALAAVVIWASALPAHADGCGGLAGRPVTWIVPFSPGGGFDVEARLLAPHLARALGTEVAVQNVTGAGGLVGAKAIRDAAPDGRTMGVVNASGLTAVAVLDEKDAPTVDEFTVLARTGTQRHVWMVRQDSPIRTADDLIARGKAGELVFAATDLGGASFLSTVLGGSLLGFEPEIVAGYRGSAELRVAVLRGDIDAISGTFESSIDMLATEELRPILQLAEAPISDDPVLAGVPVLGGPDGVAARQAAAEGGDAVAAVARASLVAEVTGMGRFLVAPAGLPTEIEACLADAVARVLADPAAQKDIQAARRTLQPLTGPEAAALAREVVGRAGTLRPDIEQALAKTRS